MTPDEITSLDQRIALTFIPGMRPVASYLLRYYEEKREVFKRRCGWLHETREACRMLITAALFLLISAGFAVVMTKFVTDKLGKHQELQEAPVQMRW